MTRRGTIGGPGLAQPDADTEQQDHQGADPDEKAAPPALGTREFAAAFRTGRRAVVRQPDQGAAVGLAAPTAILTLIFGCHLSGSHVVTRCACAGAWIRYRPRQATQAKGQGVAALPVRGMCQTTPHN